MRKRKQIEEELERELGVSFGTADGDDDTGEDDESPKRYKNAREEIIAEFGDELIGGYGKQGRRLPATLTRSECEQLTQAYTTGKWAFRNNLITRLMYTSGIRLAEEENLSVADIRFENETLFVRQGKEGKDRYTFVDEETLDMLRTWIEGKKLTDSLFGISDRQIARIVEKAGEVTGVAEKYAGMKRRFSPHSLRHSYATHCYEKGMTVFVLKKLLGHEYLGTTLQYVETAMAFELEEYKKAGPFAKTTRKSRDRNDKRE